MRLLNQVRLGRGPLNHRSRSRSSRGATRELLKRAVLKSISPGQCRNFLSLCSGAFFGGKFVAALKCAFQHNELCFSGDLTLLAQPKIFISWLRPPFRNDWVVYSKPSSVARRMCSRSGPSHPTRRHLQPSTRPACRPQGYLSLVRLCSQQLTEVGDPYRSMSYYVSSYCTCFAPVYMDFARNDTGEWEHRDFENAQVRFRSGNSGDGAKTQAGPLQTKEPVFDYNGNVRRLSCRPSCNSHHKLSWTQCRPTCMI